MNALELLQGSPEWLSYRAGKITSSGICDLMAKSRTTGDWLQSRYRYLGEIVRDRLALDFDPTYQPPKGYVNSSMLWGIDIEPEARTFYCAFNDCDVRQVGFVDHPNIPLSGCSPDGLVGEDGLVEIKCPETHTHIKTLLTEKIDYEYIVQMQWQMACTGRQWCDFISFDPRLPPRLQFFCKRVARDQDAITNYETHVREFQIEIADTLAQLDRKYPPLEQAA